MLEGILAGSTRTGRRLFKAGLTTSEECPWCPGEVERQYHLFWTCPRCEAERAPYADELRAFASEQSVTFSCTGLLALPESYDARCRDLEQLSMVDWAPVDLSPAEIGRLVKVPHGGVEYVLAATDGSCLDPRDEDLRRAGLGVFWRAECRANMRSRLGGIVQSNQRAEAVAILVALRQAAHSSLPLMIWSDSRYCVDLMELLLSPCGASNDAIWASWDHADVWVLINDCLSELPSDADGRPILVVQWVKAHTDYGDVVSGRVEWLHWYMNREADRLAGEGSSAHTMTDEFRQQHHRLLRLTALTHVMMIKVLLARQHLAPVAERLLRLDDDADAGGEPGDDGQLSTSASRSVAERDELLIPPLVWPPPALPTLPPPPPPPPAFSTAAAVQEAKRRRTSEATQGTSPRARAASSSMGGGDPAASVGAPLDCEERDGCQRAAPTDGRPDLDRSERRRLFPNFAWDPPARGTRRPWGQPPKLLGMSKARNPVDRRDTVWHWPREYFAAACWYLSRLEWDLADGSIGGLPGAAQASTPIVVLALDFMAATGLPRIASSRNTVASWAKTSVNVYYTNLAKIGDAVAAIFRRAAQLCRCEPFPVRQRGAVHTLKCLGFGPVPGVPARAKLMQHDFVADVLFHRACAWNRTRPSTSSTAGCLDLELPPPWGWPARLWQPSFHADGRIVVDAGRAPDPEPGRAVPASPLVGEKRRLHGWKSHKVRARTERWEQHNTTAIARGKHVVAALPDPDMEMLSRERDELEVSCERCERRVKAKRLDDFYKETCPGKPPPPQALGRLLPPTLADRLLEAKRLRHNATAEARGLHRMRPLPERREGQVHACLHIGCLDCAQEMRRDEVGRFLRMPCARHGGQIFSMKEARKRFAAPTADENFEEWRRDHNDLAPQYGWHKVKYLPPLGDVSVQERQRSRLECSLCGRTTGHGTRSRWEGDDAETCLRQQPNAAARRSLPATAGSSSSSSSSSSSGVAPPAKRRRSASEPACPVMRRPSAGPASARTSARPAAGRRRSRSRDSDQGQDGDGLGGRGSAAAAPRGRGARSRSRSRGSRRHGS